MIYKAITYMQASKELSKIWQVNIYLTDFYQGYTFWDYPQSCVVSVRDCFSRKKSRVKLSQNMLKWLVKETGFGRSSLLI